MSSRVYEPTEYDRRNAYNRKPRYIHFAATIAALLCIFAFLSALLPLCLDLDNVQSTMIAFSVLLALGSMILYSTKNKVILETIGPIVLFGFIAAVIGACVNIPTNPSAYGYEIFSVVIISILSIASYGVISKLFKSRDWVNVMNLERI